jgi:thiol:disulfide interchange protein DsbD
MTRNRNSLTVVGTFFLLAVPALAVAAGSGGAGAAGTGSLSARFASSGLLLQLVLAFVAGLALNLTPCVYPLIPITIGFFVAQDKKSRAGTWLLAATYVLGMSVTYSVLGVAAALSGRLFGSAMQSRWVVGTVVAVMLALAASMFGLWELRVPIWATRISGGRRGPGGALLMGLVVGLVAAPCIGPFVLGLLTYVGQRQNVVLGFLLFFALAVGLGVPYLFLGVFTTAIERLPNSGAWMLGVRELFGVLLVALAGYFARPLLNAGAAAWLLPVLLVVGGLYLLLIARPGHQQPVIDRFMRTASLALVVAGILLVPSGHVMPSNLVWHPYDEPAVEQALASGGPVVLDFYADWCLPCKELDEKTFSQPDVAAHLSDFRLFKVNLTSGDAAVDALRARYGVVGVPTVIFYNGGKEVAGARLTGFENASALLQRIALVVGR